MLTCSICERITALKSQAVFWSRSLQDSAFRIGCLYYLTMSTTFNFLTALSKKLFLVKI